MDYARAEGIPDVEAALHEAVARLNRTLPAFKQIGGLLIRETEFEKTATKEDKKG